MFTVWRVVIKMCVTVVRLKQFSVAHCVACCYSKVVYRHDFEFFKLCHMYVLHILMSMHCNYGF